MSLDKAEQLTCSMKIVTCGVLSKKNSFIYNQNYGKQGFMVESFSQNVGSMINFDGHHICKLTLIPSYQKKYTELGLNYLLIRRTRATLSYVYLSHLGTGVRGSVDEQKNKFVATYSPVITLYSTSSIEFLF